MSYPTPPEPRQKASSSNINPQAPDLWTSCYSTGVAAAKAAQPLLNSLLSMGAKLVTDQNSNKIKDDASAVASAILTSKGNPVRGAIDMSYALYNLCSDLSTMSYRYADETMDIANKAQKVANILQEFARNHPELVEAGTKVAGMVVVDPQLSAIALAAEVYFRGESLDLKNPDLSLIDVPAQVIMLASTVRSFIPTIGAVEILLSVAYIQYMNRVNVDISETSKRHTKP